MLNVFRTFMVRHGDRFGLKNRMQIAKWVNRLSQRSSRAARQNFYSQIFAKPSLSAAHATAINDGWGVDSSRSLPFLDQVLADSDRIVARPKTGQSSLKGFMINRLNDQDFEDYPSFLNFASSPELLLTVCRYFGEIPVLSSIKLLESVAGSYAQLSSSQLFHLDHADRPLLKVILHVSDVNEESGPFCFLAKSTSAAAEAALKYGNRGCAYRVSDDQMLCILNGQYDLVQAIHPRGDILFVDTSNCFHFGSRTASRSRYLVMLQYVSSIRTDFRFGYPFYKHARSDDTPLRKALLDRHYNPSI